MTKRLLFEQPPPMPWPIPIPNYRHVDDGAILPVFLKLALNDLLSCAQVCRDWYRVASNHNIWMKFRQLHFPDIKIPDKHSNNLKYWIMRQLLRTKVKTRMDFPKQIATCDARIRRLEREMADIKRKKAKLERDEAIYEKAGRLLYEHY